MANEKVVNENPIKTAPAVKETAKEKSNPLLETAAVAALQALLTRTGGDPDRVAASAVLYAKALVEALKR